MINEKLEQVAVEEQVKKKRNYIKLFRIIAVIISLFALTIIIIYKLSNTDFSVTITIILSIIFILIPILSFFIPWIHRKLQEGKKEKISDKLPPMITLEQAGDLINKELLNPRYADHSLGWTLHYYETVGKNLKCEVLVVQLDPTVYNKNTNIYFLINMRFPEKRCLLLNPTPYDLKVKCNSLAVEPETEPATRVVEEESPLTGIRRKITETKNIEEKTKKDEKAEIE